MNKIEEISIGLIGASPMNPRKTFSDAALAELATSIRELGIFQPITVRAYKHVKGTRYEIVCGERRYRAAKIAGLDNVPCIVRELTDAQAFDAMITENLQRKDVDAFEEAFAFAELLKVKGNDVIELSKRFGKSERFVRERIKLNALIPAFKEKYQDKDITLGMALELAKLEQSYQEELVESIHWEYCHSLQELKNRLSKVDLSIAVFGLYEKLGKCKSCKSCEYNTASTLTLFAMDEKAMCMNQACFNLKQRMAIIKRASEDNLRLGMVGSGADGEAKELIKELCMVGITVYSLYDLYTDFIRYPEKDTPDYEKAIEDYEALKADEANEEVYSVCSYGRIGWQRLMCKKRVEPCKTTITTASGEEVEVSESVQEILDKKERFKKVRDENVIAEQRSFLIEKEKEYCLGITAMPGIEYSILHTLMLRYCSSEVIKYLGIDHVNMGSDDLLNKVKNFTEDQLKIIRRGFIFYMSTDGTVTYNISTQACLDAVMAKKFSEEKAAIEQRFDTVLNKRLEKLDSQIEEIKA